MPSGVAQHEDVAHSSNSESKSYGQVIEYIEGMLLVAASPASKRRKLTH